MQVHLSSYVNDIWYSSKFSTCILCIMQVHLSSYVNDILISNKFSVLYIIQVLFIILGQW